jgi:hypothetical protein
MLDQYRGNFKISEAELERQNALRDRQLKRMEDPHAGTDWIGPEYDKHVAEMRKRYPLIAQMMLRGGPEANANLTGIKDTNKYARLADAYNAQLRYVAGDWQSGGKAGEGSERVGLGKYEQVPQLNTQDQRQMDQLRQAQGDLRSSQLGMEEHYQKDYLQRKLDEMQSIQEQGYKQQYYKSNETMRQVSELFDTWNRMDEQTALAYMQKIGIPADQAKEIKRLMAQNDFHGAGLIAEGFGLTPQSASQAFENIVVGPVMASLIANPQQNPQAIAAKLGKLKGHALLGQLSGLLDAGDTAVHENGTPDATVREASATIRKTLSKLSSVANTVVSQPDAVVIAGGLTAMLASGLPSIITAAKAIAPTVAAP